MIRQAEKRTRTPQIEKWYDVGRGRIALYNSSDKYPDLHGAVLVAAGGS